MGKKKHKQVSFNDDTREITLTYENGKEYKFKAKERKPITIEMLCKVPAMAIFERGEQRQPTEKEKAQAIIDSLKQAIELDLI